MCIILNKILENLERHMEYVQESKFDSRKVGGGVCCLKSKQTNIYYLPTKCNMESDHFRALDFGLLLYPRN